MELKAGQDDFKDLRVIAEVKQRIAKAVAEVTHTILVWKDCPIKDMLQEAFSDSKDVMEKRVTIKENDTVPENTLVLMNVNVEVLEVIELEWEQ